MKAYWREYLKLLRFAKPYRFTLFMAGLCMAASTIFEGFSYSLIIPVVDRVFTNKQIIVPVALPPFLQNIINSLNAIEPMALFRMTVIAIFCALLAKNFFIFLQSYLMNIVSQGAVRNVRDQLYAKFQDLSLDFYAKKRTGELISRITNDVGYIANAISYALTDFIYQSFRVIAFSIVALTMAIAIGWQLLLVFIIFPAVMVLVVRISKRIKKYSQETQQKMADLNSLLTETIQGAYIVKVYNREDYELGRFKGINQAYFKATLRSIKRTIVLSPLIEIMGSMGAITILWIVFNKVNSQQLSFGMFGTFMTFLLQILSPLKKLSGVHAINQQALPASQRIYDVLEEEPRVKEKNKAYDLAGFNSAIRFEDVKFAYDDENYVLSDINLEMKKGQVIALVGHSGAGKSTLVSLLPRLYDPQGGRIMIDDYDIRDVTLKSLRSQIAVVSQEMVLFNASVRENIAYGRSGATDEEIIDAAEKAHAYEFIQKMPKGFSTLIGDRGVRLSGGEKQRLAIARAILKNAPVLILDEATSQLDSGSEHLIQEAFTNLMKGRTAFIIAHRLSTVLNADRIVVFEKGLIVEQGTHKELIAKNKAYKKLYDLQFNV